MPNKTKVLFVRVNEEDHARITAHAAAAGQGVAEYMRRKALEGDDLAARVERMEKRLMDADLSALVEGAKRLCEATRLFGGHSELFAQADRLDAALAKFE